MADTFIDFAGNTSDAENGTDVRSATIIPGQIDNVADELLVLMAVTSLDDGAATFTAPAGWTQLYDGTQVDNRTAIYWKRSTGGESFPNVPISASREWATTSVVVRDVDWSAGGNPFGNTGVNTSNASPTITTTANKSIILYLLGFEDDFNSGTSSITTITHPMQRNGGNWSQEGTTEGDSVHAGAAYAFIYNSGSVVTGPTMFGVGDKRNHSLEIKTLGSYAPIASDNLPLSTISGTARGTNATWVDAIVASGKLLDADTVQTWTFDASLADAVNDRITVPGHGIVTSRVVRVEDNGATLPAGLVHNSYYWVRAIDADTIEFRGTIAPDVDATTETFCNGTTLRAITDITAAGSGTCVLRDCGMMNSYGTNDIYQFPSGAASLADFTGYKGDSGWHQNKAGFSDYYATPLDLSASIYTFLLTITVSTLNHYYCIFIDSSNNWCMFKVWDRVYDGSFSVATRVQIDVSSAEVRAKAYRSQGTLNPAQIQHIVWTYGDIRNTTSATTRSGTTWDVTLVGTLSPFGVYGGSASAPISMKDAAELLDSLAAGLAANPSDLQIVFSQSVRFGNGSNLTVGRISERSIAFPPLADGVTRSQLYRANIGLTFDMGPSDDITLANSQVGASAPFDFVIQRSGSPSLVFSGNTIVKGNIVLDGTLAYSGSLFVGGAGVSHNGATMRGCTFVVTADLAADDGMIEWDSTTDIEACAFELESGLAAGHAIIVTTPGTYSFSNLTFTGFGADGSNAAAVYNNSGGLVTINIDGGTTPTYRNGAGASTTINAAAVTYELTGLIAGSEVRVYTGTDPATATEVAGVESSGTTFSFTNSYAGQSGFIVIFALGYQTIRIPLTFPSATTSVPIQQTVDRVYLNP